MVTIAHEQNIICSKIHLDGTKCDKTSICRQLFAGHVVGSQPRKMTKNMNQMIIIPVIIIVIGMYFTCLPNNNAVTKRKVFHNVVYGIQMFIANKISTQ